MRAQATPPNVRAGTRPVCCAPGSPAHLVQREGAVEQALEVGGIQRQCGAILAHRARKVAALTQRIPTSMVVVGRQLPLLALLRCLLLGLLRRLQLSRLGLLLRCGVPKAGTEAALR